MSCTTPPRKLLLLLGLAAVALLGVEQSGASAAGIDEILPATSKGFVSVPNGARLTANWNKTQGGQLLAQPTMRPFNDDLRRQLREKFTPGGRGLGITWEELLDVSGGEMAIALIQPAANQAATVAVSDTKGREQQAKALLGRIAGDMKKLKARESHKEVSGARLAIFDIPPAGPGEKPQRTVVGLRETLLVYGDNLAEVEKVLARAAAKGGRDSLANFTPYREVMARAEGAAGGLDPDARWFIEPFGFAEARRVSARKQRKRRHDWVKVLGDQGFRAIQGLGGYVNFATGPQEVLHRTAVYAPPVAGQDPKFKYTLAARMLSFPNGGPLPALDWIPRELATYSLFNWDMKNAFEFSKTLVDQLMDAEVFEDSLEGMRTDPNGPQIDLRRDLVGKLGTQAAMLSDYQLPIHPDSERTLYAFAAADPAKVADTLRRQMEGDDRAARHEVAGVVVWEIKNVDKPLAPVKVEGKGLDRFRERAKRQEDERLIPNSAMTVAHGHLLVCTHLDFLKRVLEEAAAGGQPLAKSVDYQIVTQELDRLHADKPQSFRIFSRTDESFRPNYELLRLGKLPQSKSLLAQALNGFLSDDDSDELRKQTIDGSKLPEFEFVRRYLGPAGMVVETLDDGWMLTGVTLSKQPGTVAGAAAQVK
ncbi:MAG: hypothetical protein U0836_19080 [Pirellulales bacterium]